MKLVTKFFKRLFEITKLHNCDVSINIKKIRTIQLDRNITVRAFYNRPSHTIYEFVVAIDPDFAVDGTLIFNIFPSNQLTHEIHIITLYYKVIMY